MRKYGKENVSPQTYVCSISKLIKVVGDIQQDLLSNKVRTQALVGGKSAINEVVS